MPTCPVESTLQSSFRRALFKMVIGVACKPCSPGYEFWNRDTSNHATPCRSSDHKACCRPCGENHFSTGGETCKPMDSENVDINLTSKESVAFGTSWQRQCNQSEELVYFGRDGECKHLLIRIQLD
jgi:hypothetical protein